ncbi:MAG: extracellular solute-binding protein [Pseudomonadota bacterium]|nr:extracellular solute-binding protein [Pseudomonadota bacterium]
MILLLAGSTAVLAQDAAKAARELALYQGADRHERLVEAAKKEGELTVYHVYPALPVVIAAFTKKYGIKVKVWRSGSEAVLQRLIAETRGNRFEADVVQNNAPENEAAYREKLLQEVWSPFLKDLVPAATPAHRAWAGVTLDIWTAAYNTKLVKKDELPRSYQDLLDPRWKGRLGIEADDHAWFGALLAELGEERGLKLFTQIVETNGMSARKGHSALTNLVASGDIPLALTTYSWIPEQLKKKGAPVDNWVIQPLLAQPSTIAIPKRAPNPASALLFYDFMLGEGQKLLADASFVPTSRQFQGSLGAVAMKIIDPAHVLDLQEKWLQNFDEVILKKAR